MSLRSRQGSSFEPVIDRLSAVYAFGTSLWLNSSSRIASTSLGRSYMAKSAAANSFQWG